jgi:SAM-dependent methyltransferase
LGKASALPQHKSKESAVSIVRSLVEHQRELCWSFDRRFVGPAFRLDGNGHFVEEFAPRHLFAGAVVYDIGGGKQPLILPEKKRELGLQVIGLDIDPNELARAPAGAYDRSICADIQTYRGVGDADVVICQAVLEHVPSQRAAMEGVLSVLKPGGLALVWVPSRNACYARLNLILPEGLKRRILFYLSPQAKQEHGFRAYYDCCTPRRFRALIGQYEGSIVEVQYYYRSSYFSFLLPMYLLWRSWIFAFHGLAGEEAAESFSIAFQKKALADQSGTRR